MMTEENRLHTAQDFITWKLQKTAKTKTIAITWIRDNAKPAGIYHLKVCAGAKKAVFTFTKDELTKWYDSWRWETRLLRKVQEILTE
jgi:hypothetical protein